ncbi:TetR/AcrR family transcriptional regulator [Photobacterium damselae]|uniref:TetR/AcrR family transcriptional regulator n=1 Tax=Photobacterium damselae TaxID=38293 RepID=UPI001EDF815F|nr:TetR/AcrR family transcriptional regulator [Photobacterium damselae]MCG3823341.1 TetR family transcriptional regulator [Photobacterium damselae]
MTDKGNTKSRILDAAEWLFAEHGFNETSLRTITSKANVNLASVNYHFGDKKNLIRAVLGRYLECFMPLVKTEFEALLNRDEFSMVEVFRTIQTPLLQLNQLRPNGTTLFMSLIGRGYTDVQGHLRWFIVNRYQKELSLFTTAICRANPSLDPESLFWRLHFTLGASVFTMASSKALCEIADNDFASKVDIEHLLDRLIPYLAAGVSAPIEHELTHLHRRVGE